MDRLKTALIQKFKNKSIAIYSPGVRVHILCEWRSHVDIVSLVRQCRSRFIARRWPRQLVRDRAHARTHVIGLSVQARWQRTCQTRATW
jgi:hypothetical protein